MQEAIQIRQAVDPPGRFDRVFLFPVPGAAGGARVLRETVTGFAASAGRGGRRGDGGGR